jgi:glycine/D-amino acid oxidase-like deaminating enzyme
VSLLPLGDDLYWCGATYDRYNDDPEPTQKGKSYLAGHLEKILDARYSIDFHGAGIRATTRDRRPYTGRHPEHERVHVIAGLGTKGASLAPYCANLFVDFLLDGVPIPGEVDILRHGHR